MNFEPRIKKGTAVFLPMQDNLFFLRQNTKKALLQGKEELPFFVTDEIDYYPRMLDTLLFNQKELEFTLDKFRPLMQGTENGALRCVAFWEMGPWTGILFHQSEEGMLAAHLPPLSKNAILHELDFAHRLEDLSRDAEDMKIDLDNTLPAGRWLLRDILARLSKCMKQ